MAAIALRSLGRGATAKMPMTAVTTPMAGTISGKTMPLKPNAAEPEDQGGDEGHGVGLEQVGGHAGAVTDVVAHVVGDGGGVARVVLGDVVLDLADEVGADVGSLGEDAAADPHEHREQGSPEAEALEHLGGVLVVDEHDDGGTEQAQPDGEHAGDATGTERDAQRALRALVVRGRRHPDVAAHREAHAGEAGQRGEAGADQEEQRPAPADVGACRRAGRAGRRRR